MARFERPKNTIEDAATLRTGDIIWHVYGIWPPQVSSVPHIVTREASLYRDHPSYDGFGMQADLVVFDEKWEGLERPHMAFASDGNMTPGQSHNDNYWFRSREDAEAARDYLRAEWEKNPDMIDAEVFRRRADDDAWDRVCDDEYDAA